MQLQGATTFIKLDLLKGYVGEFLLHLADHAEPLQHLTCTSEQTKSKWSDEYTMALNKLISLLTNNLQLLIFDPNHHTILATDMSNIGLGACLSQIA
uniref:Reverse transcriptase/retrotransposon-derived protein RNase H-like domain-containing protein n=1 Tax=Romanomermis culicivorax TaxID=13658 RepID=A0A915K2C5_ROMCU